MTNVWIDRDLPVLTAVVKLADESSFVEASMVEKATGLPEKEVNASLKALNDAGYFTKVSGHMGRLIDLIYGVTGEARQLAGVWPTSQQIARDFVAEVERRAESDPDPETRSRFKKIAAGIAGGGKDIGINLIAAVIAKSVGI